MGESRQEKDADPVRAGYCHRNTVARELANDSPRKIWTYLGAGAQEVWQVSAETQKVLVYRSSKSISALEIGDRLNTPVVPGWEIAVRDLFER